VRPRVATERLRSVLASAVLLAFALPSPVRADTVTLDNGDRLTGTLIDIDESYVVIETEYAGRVVVERDHVAEVETTEPHPALLDDGSTRTEPAGEIPLAEVVAVDEPPKTFDWFAEVNLGFDGRWGNSDRGSVNAQTSGKLEWTDHKLQLSADAGWERSQGTLTGSDWRASANHLWQLRGPWKLGLFSKFEHDRFQDLTLRNTTATSIAYEWLEGFGWDLTTSLGPGVIYEDDEGQENLDIGYRYNLDLERSLLGKQVRVRHDESFVGSFEDAGTFFGSTETGIKFVVVQPFSIGLNFRFDWNNRPVDGRE